ncbi:valine--tRNA ligase, partial [Helicobacter pylori]
LTLSLQDILARYKRMDGYKTLYQPGLDHAGIATQNVVEKQLLSQGIKKEDLGREEFIKKVWEWKEKSGGAILEQMKHLGVSAAFSRTRFTMDKGLQRAVKLAFLKWYEQGLIVQDNYMVNWCTKDGALSDIEVEYEERKGALYYIRYYLENQKDYLVVATTRPETLFGDSALMVNPNDERYKHLVGQKAI